MVTDPVVMVAAGSDLVAAGVVVQQLEDVIAEAVADALGVPPTTADQLVEGVLDETGAAEALGLLVEDLVTASMVEPGQEAVIDVAARLQPVARSVAEKASALGYKISQQAIEEAIASIEPVVVKPAGALPTVGSGSPVARSLGIATVLSGSVMAASGAALVGLAGWSRVVLRSLFARVALSGFTFSVFLQLSGWVLDPVGGRAPVRSALAHTLSAKAWVPVAVGVVPALAWLWSRRRFTRVAGSPDSSAGPTLRGERLR